MMKFGNFCEAFNFDEKLGAAQVGTNDFQCRGGPECRAAIRFDRFAIVLCT